MFKSIRRWLEKRAAAEREVRTVRPPAFEPLEPRLFLDAEVTGVSSLPSPGVTATDAGTLLDASPALFVENQGQWSDPSVRYAHDGNQVDVAATDTGILFQVARADLAEGARDATTTVWGGPGSYLSSMPQDSETQMLRFSASFMGADQVSPVGLDRSQSEFNYFVGSQSAWRVDVPAYESVVYEGLYEGIDLHIQGLRSHLKYEFHVAPGAAWSRISIGYDGIEGLTLAADGSLVLNLGGDWGTIVDDAPYIYQVIGGRQVSVAGGFRLLNGSLAFEVTGAYDPAYELVIDPDLVWTTCLGGTDGDWGYGVAVDSSGNVYLTGQTQSSNWTSDGFDTTYNGIADVFVAKFSPTGDRLWSTYLGGSDTDWGCSVAADSSGNVYVTGPTWSAEWAHGGFDTTYNGASDAFVAKLSPSGACLWSTYVGGSDGDWGYGLAIDSAGNICVTGQTWSLDWVIGGYDMTFNGGSDAFAVKLSPSGACLWGTYIGGTEWDWGRGLAVDSAGNIYVTGATLSSNWTTGGGDMAREAPDVFVAKLSPTGRSLWSAYLGGSKDDWGYGIAVDSAGNIYVTGATLSSDWTTDGVNAAHDDMPDAFVAKLSPTGGGLWSISLGGSESDWGNGIAVGPSGNVWVTGMTGSAGWASGGFDTTYNGGDSDAFVAGFSPTGSCLWSAYLGGSGGDQGYALVVDSAGYIHVTGQTRSSSWPAGDFGAPYVGGGDAFLAKIPVGRLVPMYRFWSPVNSRHFYTIDKSERDKLIDKYSSVWTYEGVVYRTFADDSQPGVSPIYRFWSGTLKAHFYTINAGERDKLINEYANVWAYEGEAFYAYADGFQPAGVLAVYRFWSDSLGCHFYTMSKSERDKLINSYSNVWTYEMIAWYAWGV